MEPKQAIFLGEEILKLAHGESIPDILTGMTLALSYVMIQNDLNTIHGVERGLNIITESILGEGYEVRILQRQDA